MQEMRVFRWLSAFGFGVKINLERTQHWLPRSVRDVKDSDMMLRRTKPGTIQKKQEFNPFWI